jgi:DNA-binding CsgD family transcriptional regulator
MKASLTPREGHIAHLVSSGLSNDEIADYLKLAPQTVKNGMRVLFIKAGVRNRVELAAWYLQMEELRSEAKRAG